MKHKKGKLIHLVFEPRESKSNKYVDILTSELEKRRYRLYSLGKVFKKPSVFLKIKIFHLNWFESLLGKNRISIFSDFFKRFFQLLLIKIFNKRLIWTMHNKMPHNQSLSELKVFFLKLIIRWADGIVIHCKESLVILERDFHVPRRKVFFLPHPNYINRYGPLLTRSISSNNELNILFLGAVKPYKNIELLVDVMRDIDNKSITLSIVGKPFNESYKEKIEDLAKGLKNVKLKLEFVDDLLVGAIIAEHNIFVLPYDMTSSLNSGSVFLAFSYARTIISPKIGTVKDFENYYEKMFVYDYNTALGHKEALKNAILRAYEDFSVNKEKIIDYGRQMYEYVKLNHNPDLVGDELSRIYENIL